MDYKTKKTFDKNLVEMINIDNKNIGIDFAGCEIHKGSYGDKNSSYCWNVDHIKSKKNSGRNDENNLQPVHICTNEQKSKETAGIIKIKYQDKIIYTEFEVRENIFFDSNGIGIIFIKKQYDDSGKIYVKNRYFFNGMLIRDTGKQIKYNRIDLRTSLKKNYLCMENEINYL